MTAILTISIDLLVFIWIIRGWSRWSYLPKWQQHAIGIVALVSAVDGVVDLPRATMRGDLMWGAAELGWIILGIIIIEQWLQSVWRNYSKEVA